MFADFVYPAPRPPRSLIHRRTSMRIHPETRRSARFTSRLLFGFALIALGGAVLLHNTGLLDLDTTGRWWPALLIAFGLERLWSRGFLEALSGHLLLVGGTA